MPSTQLLLLGLLTALALYASFVLAVALEIAYLALPFDLVPDFIPVAG
jgi:uncharacterized membrane protein YkvA (DUF1232 family)